MGFCPIFYLFDYTKQTREGRKNCNYLFKNVDWWKVNFFAGFYIENAQNLCVFYKKVFTKWQIYAIINDEVMCFHITQYQI